MAVNLSQIFSQAGINTPSYYRSSDAGIKEYQSVTDTLSQAQLTNTPAKVDLSQALTLGKIRGENDPFYLQSLGQIATNSSVDSGTQQLALRQLANINTSRQASGLSQIAIPGTSPSTLKAPAAFNGTLPTLPAAPGAAPSYPSLYNINSVTTATAPSYKSAINAYLGTGSSLSSYTVNQTKTYLDQINTANINKYNTSLTSYNTMIADYPNKLSAYQSALNQYQTGLAANQAQVISYQKAKSAEDAQNAALDQGLSVLNQQAENKFKDFQDQQAAVDRKKHDELLKFSVAGLSNYFSGQSVKQMTPSTSAGLFRPKLGGK